jgi:phage shock protein A
MELMKAQYRQMEIRLQSYQESQTELDENARCVLSPEFELLLIPIGSVYRRQIQALEAQLSQAKRKADKPSRRPEEIAAFVAEKTALLEANAQLTEDNTNLREDLEDMTAMVEVLKGQVSGRKGLVSDPRMSPILSDYRMSPILSA